MKIYSAPLQGFTEAVWRNIHNEVFGGIDSYITPFVRIEKGEIRNKDIRDIEKKNNNVGHLIPQIIASTPDELIPLTEFIIGEGYSEIDINMGCSFSLQVRKHHGAGLLPHPDEIQKLLKATERFPETEFSVKMRLGLDNNSEWREVLQQLNEAKLSHITLHPRLGRDQYKEKVNLEEFALFYEECRHPLVYNGDLSTIEDINEITNKFPKIEGIMLGRGLLANPALAFEFKQGKKLSDNERKSKIAFFHDRFYQIMSQRLQGNTQLLGKLKPYWEYLLPEMEKKYKKAILKSTTAEKYLAAVNNAIFEY